MKPYYADDACTIYHGDALDVLASIESSVDAVVTDPPYASGTRHEAAKSSSGAMLRAGRFSERPIDRGRRAIGIEVEERYCEIAARRLAQEVLPL